MSLLGANGAKRSVDVVGAVCGIVLLAGPMLVTAGAIRLRMGSPVFFRQKRLGRGGREFRVIKFRTMVVDAQKKGSGLYLDENDPRLPPLGRLLRSTSLDELPQLFNVLAGDMSLVGPRPMVPEIVEQYRDEYEVILETKPGITGLAQVNGRENLPRSRRLALDMEYVRSRDLRLDLRILWRTVGVVLSRQGQRDSMSPEELER